MIVEKEFPLPDGSIHYRLRKGSGPLLVFIYGGLGQIDQHTWDELIELLPEETSILTFDRPGIGKNKKSGLPRTAENVTSELKSLLDSLDFDSHILIGHSIGGLYARYYACRFPQKVAGLVLLDSTHEDQLEKGKKYYDPGALEAGRKSAADNPEGIQLPEDLDTSFSQMRKYRLPENVKTVIAVAKESLPPQIPGADKLNELNVNLHHELSRVSSNCDFHVIENTSHMIYMEQPQKTVEIIKSVL